MSVWAFCADTHIWSHRAWAGETIGGINARGRRCLAVIEEALSFSVDMEVTDFAILGDVFDQSKPSPQLVHALGRVFLNFPKIRKHLLVGNHDQYSSDLGDHALAPFALMPGIYVYERPAVFQNVLFLPYRREPVANWLHKELGLVRESRPAREPTILAAHFGLKTSETPFFLKDAPDAYELDGLRKVMQAHGFDRAYVGNWHTPLVSKHDINSIYQCGTLIPAGFDDQRPGGLLIDSGRSNASIHNFKTQPIFRIADFKEVRKGMTDGRSPPFLRVKNCPHSKYTSLAEELDEGVADGTIEGYEIETVATDGSRPSEVFMPNDHRELTREYLATTFPKDKTLQGFVFDALESRYKVFG